MRLSGITLVAALFVPVAATAAEPVRVKSGVPKGIVQQTIYNPQTCQYGALPTARITQPPAHGKVEVVKITYVVAAGKACAGQTFKGTAIVYTSTRGYRGPDAFGFEFSWDTFVNAAGTSGQRGAASLMVE